MHKGFVYKERLKGIVNWKGNEFNWKGNEFNRKCTLFSWFKNCAIPNIIECEIYFTPTIPIRLGDDQRYLICDVRQ